MTQTFHIFLSLIFIAFVQSCGGASFGGGGERITAEQAAEKTGALGEGSTPTDDSKTENDVDQDGDDEGDDLTEGEENEETEESITAEEARDLLSGDPNADTIANCLAGWGDDTGLTADAIRKYRTFTADAVGFSSSEINDRTATKKPSLVLIDSKATGFATVSMDLGNPNGFYCLKGANVGFSGRTIKKHCRATIGADSVTNTGFSGSNMSEYGSECD